MSQRGNDAQDSGVDEEIEEREQVGYKKPPIKNRFRRGYSGNRNGRPRGRQNIKALASKMFDMRIAAKIGDVKIKLPYFEALIRALRVKAMRGDLQSQRGLVFIMEQLGMFDEKSAPEKQGVMVLPDRPLNEEEWLFWVHRYEPDNSKRKDERLGTRGEE